MSSRDSKPRQLFSNPGFVFGCPQTQVSGFATLKSRRQVDDAEGVYHGKKCVNMHLQTHDAASHAVTTLHHSSFTAAVQ